MNLAKTCTTVLKSTSATATTVAANTTASTSKEDSSVLAQKECSCTLMERAVSSNVTLAKMSDQTKSATTLLLVHQARLLASPQCVHVDLKFLLARDANRILLVSTTLSKTHVTKVKARLNAT